MASPPHDPLELPSSSISSESESDAESVASEGFVPLARTRVRRSNFGSKLAGLLAQETLGQDVEAETGDDYDLEKFYLEDSDGNPISEAEIEDEDAEFVDKDADAQADEHMDSSDEDEDAGPPGEGDEDLEGEHELRREEKQEKKRKAKDVGIFKIPALRKRAKLAESAKPGDGPDTVNTETGAKVSRSRRKSERASWIPTEAEGPVRQSSRTLAVKNKQETHERLVQSEKLRKKLAAQMRSAEERKEKTKIRPMNQAERLAEAARTERMNSKSLFRWEDAERKRVEEQRARLEALKNKKMDGPFVRYYSGPAIWIDDKLRSTGTEVKIEVIREEVEEQVKRRKEAAAKAEEDKKKQLEEEAKERELEKQQQKQLATASDSTPALDSHPSLPAEPYPLTASGPQIMFAPPQGVNSFLFGIHEYASQPAPAPAPAPTPTQSNRSVPPYDPVRAAAAAATPTTLQMPPPFQPMPSDSDHQNTLRQTTSPLPQPPLPAPTPYQPPGGPPLIQHQPDKRYARPQASNPALPYLMHPTAHNPTQYQYHQPASNPPERPVSPPPPKVTLATRNCVILENFSTEENPNPFAKDKDKEAMKRVLFPHWSGLKPYKQIKVRTVIPCALTLQPARYKDPNTGLAYMDSYAYKSIQRLVGGSALWSPLLECFVGPKIGWGKPAYGVPTGFWNAEDRKRMKQALPPPPAILDLTKEAEVNREQQISRPLVIPPAAVTGSSAVKREGVTM